MNNIYDYIDYREFLSDRIDHLREKNPNFSYRYFNKKAGLKSPSYLKEVISGSKNIGSKGMYGICVGLGLSEKEARFFESLVRFNQSKSFDDKEKYYLEMSKKYPSEHPRILESKFFSIFSHWYYAAILELIRLDNFRENPHWISRALKPNVPVLDIRKAIEDLLELGLLLRNKKGALERTDKSITTPEGVSDVAIIKYQQQLTRLAQMSIERDEVEHKESSTMTVALSNDTFKKVKGKMKEFHLEILKLIEDQDDNKTTIANINLQMFKLMNEGA